MTLRPIADVIQKYIPKTSEEACLLIGVEPKQVPADGKYHTVNLTNDPHGTNCGQILIWLGGLCGCVCNTKTGARKLFINFSNATPVNSLPKQSIKNPCKSNNIVARRYITLIKQILNKGTQS